MAPKAAEEQKAGKSKAEKRPVVKKAEKKIKADTKGEGKKKKKSKKSVETYKIYIYKVLKQVRVLSGPIPVGFPSLV
jgi:histone H2B